MAADVDGLEEWDVWEERVVAAVMATKLCNQVSDAVLDARLEKDPPSKVVCETATKDNLVMVAGVIYHAAGQEANEGHPDKLCVQVSDAGLDAGGQEDPVISSSWGRGPRRR